ncbi:MAG: hypothetical protein IJR49_00960 [Treponema sp.]|nr:hypothetical protein [Treponema sp.]
MHDFFFLGVPDFRICSIRIWFSVYTTAAFLDACSESVCIVDANTKVGRYGRGSVRLTHSILSLTLKNTPTACHSQR